MLQDEINLVLIGDDWHALPYQHRHKADLRVAPDEHFGYMIHVLRLGINVWELRDVQEAMRCCQAYHSPECSPEEYEREHFL